jgi:hypothetical protein
MEDGRAYYFCQTVTLFDCPVQQDQARAPVRSIVLRCLYRFLFSHLAWRDDNSLLRNGVERRPVDAQVRHDQFRRGVGQPVRE